MSASSPRRKRSEKAETAVEARDPAGSWQRAARRHSAGDTPARAAPTRPAKRREKKAEPRTDARAHEVAGEKPLGHIIRNLERAYGVPVNKWTGWDPLDMLVATILSQATSDTNSDRTWAALKRRFPNWEEVLRARESTLAETIREGGLANQKAHVIRELLHEVKKRTGALTLEHLRRAPVEEAARFLSSLRGVGPKTVACTLLFACGKDVFPLDTHIFRILRRVGLITSKCSDARAHAIMSAIVPAGKFYSFHVNLIRHGRKICRPRDPLCEQCPIVEYCDFGQAAI